MPRRRRNGPERDTEEDRSTMPDKCTPDDRRPTEPKLPSLLDAVAADDQERPPLSVPARPVFRWRDLPDDDRQRIASAMAGVLADAWRRSERERAEQAPEGDQ